MDDLKKKKEGDAAEGRVDGFTCEIHQTVL